MLFGVVQVFLFLMDFAATAVLTPRLSLAEWNSYFKQNHNGPGTFAFGYDVEDADTNNVQFRQEEKYPNGTVIGSYGLLEPNGNVKIAHYEADHQGYRVKIENSKSLRTDYPLRSSRQDEPSTQLQTAVQSLATLGQNVAELRLPPKFNVF